MRLIRALKKLIIGINFSKFLANIAISHQDDPAPPVPPKPTPMN